MDLKEKSNKKGFNPLKSISTECNEPEDWDRFGQFKLSQQWDWPHKKQQWLYKQLKKKISC